jgi:putative inorganic carbon (hco3(-)) transporter
MVKKRSWFEGVLLTTAAPFLLFPEIVPGATAVSLLLITLIWLRPLPPNPFNLPLLLFVFMLGVGVAVTADPDLTLPYFTMLLLGLTVWCWLTRHVDNSAGWRLALTFFAVLGAGYMFLGLLTADWMYKIAAIETVLTFLPQRVIDLPGRTDGIHPNMLAAATLPFFTLLPPLIYVWVWQRRDWRGGLFLMLGWLLTTAVLLLTQSRSAYIGAIAAALILLIWAISLLPASRQKYLLLGGLAVCLLLGAAAATELGLGDLQSFWDDPRQQTSLGSTASLGFRQEVWRWSVVAVADFPFTGMGLGSYSHVLRRFYPVAVTPAYTISHAHNQYLQTALDVGLPGLIAYLALVITAFRIIWRTAQTDRALRPAVMGLGAGLAAYLIFGLTDAVPFGAKPSLLFWYLFGLIATLPRVAREQFVQNGRLPHNSTGKTEDERSQAEMPPQLPEE